MTTTNNQQKTETEFDGESGAKPDGESGAKPDGESGAKPDGESGSDSGTGFDDDRIQTEFVDAVRTIETSGGDPVSAAVLTDVSVDGGVVTAVVDLAGIGPDVGDRICNQLSGAGFAIPGVPHVRIESPDRDRTGGTISPSGVESILAVCGAKGGVGKSTLTMSLARRLSNRGLDVGIFDADVEAPDVSQLLGVDAPVESTPAGNPSPARVDGIQVIGIDLVAGDRPTAWHGAMAHDVIADLLGNAAWSDRDVLLCDLPPGLGDVADVVFQRVPVDAGIVVTTPGKASRRHAARTAGLLDAHGVPAIALAENMAGEPGMGCLEECDVAALLEEASTDPQHVAIPFDGGLSSPTAGEDDPGFELDAETEAALASLTETVAESLKEDDGIPDEAVDLSGLPERFRERQAILEVVSAPDGPRPLVASGGHLPGFFRDECDREISVEELADGRRLIRPDGNQFTNGVHDVHTTTTTTTVPANSHGVDETAGGDP